MATDATRIWRLATAVERHHALTADERRQVAALLRTVSSATTAYDLGIADLAASSDQQQQREAAFNALGVLQVILGRK